MNIYVVVEGEVGEKQVYRAWIPCVNNQLIFASQIEHVVNNNFYIIHGGGYPKYYSVIESAITDISTIVDAKGDRLFNRLVVAIDSEEYSYTEKRDTVNSVINDKLTQLQFRALDYKIIVQDFCLEAWGLGNRRIINPNKNKDELDKYARHYNVRKKDPALLTPFAGTRLTRAQHAENYLKAALLHKHRNLTYTKSNPQAILSEKYFIQLKKRLSETGHIQSFQDFLDAFT